MRRSRDRGGYGAAGWRAVRELRQSTVIEHRFTEARRRYGELAYLNFPRRGERQVMPADELFCRHGHERRLHTHYGPDGRPQCRLCNALARARSAARRKART